MPPPEEPAAVLAHADAPPRLTRCLRWGLVGAAAALVVALDQASKGWARTLDEPVELIGSLRFNLAFNSGAAFSRFEGWGSIIGIVGIAVIAVLIRTSLSITSRLGAVCIGLVIGGALGNLVDRVVQPGEGLFGGKVTDFVDLQWWPIFNVADMALTGGGVVLVVATMFRPTGTGFRR